MEIPEAFQECSMLFNFISDRVTTLGRLNRPKGNEFFKRPAIVENRFPFLPPHGCYACIVKYFTPEFVETSPKEHLAASTSLWQSPFASRRPLVVGGDSRAEPPPQLKSERRQH